MSSVWASPSQQPHSQTGIGFSIASGIALVFYFSAMLLEAANKAKRLPWNRSFTASELLESLQATTVMHLANLQTNPSGSVAVAGMILFLLYSVTLKRRVPSIAIWLHLPILLLLPYSWIGLFLSLIFPAIILLDGMDGEFLSDGFPRAAACGFWTLVLILTLLIRRFERSSTNLPTTDL